MNDQLKRVLRTALQGFVSGLALALANSQVNYAEINLDAAKLLVIALVTAGVSGAVSAVHNYILDPSDVPSLAPKPPEG